MSAKQTVARKPFQPPRLVRYGRIEKITMASSTGDEVPTFTGGWFGISPNQS